MSFFVHETSFVERGATIGENSKIWFFCHIMPGASIGKNTQLGQNVFVDKAVKIGDNVKIQNNVSIYQDVEIEDDVFLGPSCVFTNVINPRAFIEKKNEFRKTVVKKGATVGANATIICGVTIGEYAFVGAGAVVTKDVPPHSLVYGVPAMILGRVNDRCEIVERY